MDSSLSHRYQPLWRDYNIPSSETSRQAPLGVRQRLDARQRNKVHTLKGAQNTKGGTLHWMDISRILVPREQNKIQYRDMTWTKLEISWDVGESLRGKEADARVDGKKCGRASTSVNV